MPRNQIIVNVHYLVPHKDWMYQRDMRRINPGFYYQQRNMHSRSLAYNYRDWCRNTRHGPLFENVWTGYKFRYYPGFARVKGSVWDNYILK